MKTKPTEAPESKQMEDHEDTFKVEQALDDHLRVAKHQANPKMMKAVKALAKEKKAHLGSLDLGHDPEKPRSIKDLKAKAGIET